MEYKDIWYPSPSDSMNLSDISQNQADSVNEKLVEIKQKGLINVTENLSETYDVLKVSPSFPGDPVSPEGMAVWDTSLGAEIRVRGTDRQVQTGMVPVPVRSVVPVGSGSGFQLDGISGVNFSQCTAIYLNNIFTPDFDFYKIYLNLIGQSSNWSIVYVSEGARVSLASLGRTTIFNNASTAAFTASTASAYPLSLTSLSTVTEVNSEITISNPLKGYYNSSTHTSGLIVAGISMVSSGASSYSIADAPQVTGIGLMTPAGTAQITSGSIKVYGYANSLAEDITEPL